MSLSAVGSRLHAIRTAMSLAEWGRLSAMFAFILALNAAGWGIFALYVLPHHFDYRGEGGSAGLGVALTAWLLGFRHAFDADHISCIDNTTRKLMADGKRPIGTGFFFSFGHCTVIVGVGVGITFAARAVFGAMVTPTPPTRPRAGPSDDPVGLVPVPDRGAELDRARPMRKVRYNLVITGLSIGAAFIIGTIEILGVLTSEIHLRRVMGVGLLVAEEDAEQCVGGDGGGGPGEQAPEGVRAVGRASSI